MKKLVFYVFLLINFSLAAFDEPPALALSFFKRLSTQGIQARVLHLSSSTITTDYGTCIITDDEIIITIDGQTIHWTTPGGPWDIEYYSQTGELKLVPRKPIEIPSFQPYSFESVVTDFPTPQPYVSRIPDMPMSRIEIPVIQAPAPIINTPPIVERPLPERTLAKVSEKETAPIDQEKAIATLLADSKKLIFQKLIFQIQNSSEEQVNQIIASIKAQIKKQQIDPAIFFKQLNEYIDQIMGYYTPPHRYSALGLATTTVILGGISVGLFALVYHLYKKRNQSFTDKLAHIESEIKKRGGKITQRHAFGYTHTDIITDHFPSQSEHNQFNSLQNDYVSVDNQRKTESTLETILGTSGLFTSVMTIIMGINGFHEWYYQWDKKRYHLLCLLKDGITQALNDSL